MVGPGIGGGYAWSIAFRNARMVSSPLYSPHALWVRARLVSGVPCGPGADQSSGRELIQTAICWSVRLSSLCVTSCIVISGWGRVPAGGGEGLGGDVVMSIDSLFMGTFECRANVAGEGVVLVHSTGFTVAAADGGVCSGARLLGLRLCGFLWHLSVASE